jgi:hypothetical protein
MIDIHPAKLKGDCMQTMPSGFIGFVGEDLLVGWPMKRYYNHGPVSGWYVAHPPAQFTGLFVDEADADAFITTLLEMT